MVTTLFLHEKIVEFVWKNGHGHARVIAAWTLLVRVFNPL